MTRAQLFNSSHSTANISSNKLYQIYRANGITRKKIRQTKLLNAKKQQQTDSFLQQVYAQLRHYVDSGTLVIYLDEVMFTVRSVNTREFSNKYENIAVDLSKINIKTTAVIAAITYEHGVLLHGCFDRSVNIDKFKFYID